jgi:hypothetical protein
MQAGNSFFKWSVIFCLLQTSVFGAVTSPANITESGTFENLVMWLRRDYRLPVGVEYGAQNPAEVITAGRALDELSALPEGTLTQEQKNYLNWARQALKSDPQNGRNTAIAVKEKTGAINLPQSATPEQVLRALVKNFDDYTYDACNATYVIKPKASDLTTKELDFSVENATPAEAYKALADTVLRPNNIHLVGRGFDGGVSRASPEPREAYPYSSHDEIKITLKIKNVNIYDILCQFSQALGPDVYWEIFTVDSKDYNLAFGKL